jgi:hypothetical protein
MSQPRGVENRSILDMITSGARTRRGPGAASPGERRKRCCKAGVSINPAGAVSFTVTGVTAPHPDTSDAPGNLLAPEPAVRTGALIGYARVSTSGQLLDWACDKDPYRILNESLSGPA